MSQALAKPRKPQPYTRDGYTVPAVRVVVTHRWLVRKGRGEWQAFHAVGHIDACALEMRLRAELAAGQWTKIREGCRKVECVDVE